MPGAEQGTQQPQLLPLRVLIAGGGTGGHVIPALTIGRALRDVHGAEILFVGTARGLEAKLIPAEGFRLELVRSGPLKNVSWITRLRTLLDLPLGICRCIRLLGEFKPQVVLGVGGYASGPAMIAAVLRRIPSMAYEPNAVPGLANRIVGRYVSAAAVSFARTTEYFRNATVTGVPVREEIFGIPYRSKGNPRLLVTAGSQGAKVFNEILPRIAVRLMEAIPCLKIVHQAGPRNEKLTYGAYVESGADMTRWRVAAFLDDMPTEYAACDLVLARSGSTVAELAAAGKPAVLVPFPQAADDHQRKNAEVFAEAGAAIMLLQAHLSDEVLLTELTRLLRSPEALQKMSVSARSLARPGALGKIADIVLSLAKRKK